MSSDSKWESVKNKNYSILKLLVYFLLWDLLLSLLSILLFYFFPSQQVDISSLNEQSFTITLITLVFFAPFIETLIFQFGIIEGISLFFKNVPEKIIIFTCSLAFALSHLYNWLYFFIIFFVGLLYAKFYILVRKRSDIKTAIFFVTFLHSISNFISFIIDEV